MDTRFLEKELFLEDVGESRDFDRTSMPTDDWDVERLLEGREDFFR